ncbi:MAG: CcmD family protein [Methanosarcinales archaeon]|nr:CcmD family protein [Methanosarcinales archaeon]MCK4652177.1 CcmD family protein [Methanosarcinales archaeon]MCK4811187.1 CcmD family protein [Methanosarcinales archaeon]
MNYLLCAFGIVWLGLGLYMLYLLRTRSRLSKLITEGTRGVRRG